MTAGYWYRRFLKEIDGRPFTLADISAEWWERIKDDPEFKRDMDRAVTATGAEQDGR